MSAAEADVATSLDPAVAPSLTRPRVVVRADLRLAVLVLCVVAAIGVPLGPLWTWLAPPEVVRVLTDPVSGQLGVLPLPWQSEHRFDGMAIFVLLGLAAGVLTAAAVWLLRRGRGPVVLLAAVLGALVAAWLAMRTGVALAQWRYPGVTDVQPGDLVQRAPVLESGWVVVAQPFGVAIVYSLLVAWNGTDDLS